MADQELDRGALRASHADRDRVVEALQAAAGDGRLTADELDERLELALTAKTYAELTGLLRDLPATGTALSPAGAMPAPAKDLVTMHYTSGHGERRGRWVVPKRMAVAVTSGHIKLDFTEAIISEPELHMDVEVRSGHLQLITRPGIAVETDHVSVRSGQIRVREPWGGDVPVQLRIYVTGTCGSGHVIARPPRRSLWEWLRRAPRRYQIPA